MASAEIPTVSLNNGTTIPQLGFGVYQVPPDETERAVLTAFEAGYRHIDTAQMYQNEAGVGRALRSSGLAREDVYITTKLNNDSHEPAVARAALEQSLRELDVEQVDLFLIHWPLPTRYGGDYVSTWRTLTELAAEGKAASVGVSNFHPEHLKRIVDETGIVPAINQIEVHPYLTNEEARLASGRLDVAVEAWSPIAQGAVLDDPVLVELAEKYGKTPAQVTLRWHIERGDIIFPKSVTPERVKENADIFDFSLTADEVNRITGLDKGEEGRTGPNPDTFDWIPGA
ncbi:2,5-diketo-D-gluconate reductase A [Nocardioides zeae]|uniref:2,5-diketo-D-gluconate reductase A n=1 Tax=Nocardioides zeae TaxID=1457234 RepID=A0ACC6IE86_9ACTN|nr:aldo/keto reductase [Nocardioides zeae]MDR6174113.1 2,5-diketo-D-gluconate reductase A [Nocardioides zeae]MDR6208920.1 2,5-diketo-D-gluconate reductase A [Nocardioides zeae]